MSVTTRAVFDSYHRSSGDFVNFKTNTPLHRGATALIFRKAEYPNMNYSVKSGNSNLEMTITSSPAGYAQTFNLTLATYDVGVGVPSSNQSFFGILKELNTLIAAALTGTTKPSSIFFTNEGEFVVLKIESPVSLGYDYTAQFTNSTLVKQLGFVSGTDLSKTSLYTIGASQLYYFCGNRSQTLTRHHIILCSKTLSQNSEQKSNVDPYFIMRLPIDPFGNPGDKQLYVPLNETRIWPIQGQIQQEIDFYIKPEHGGSEYQNENEGQRLVVYFDIFYGDLTSEITRVLH